MPIADHKNCPPSHCGWWKKTPTPLGPTQDPRHMLRLGPRRVRFLMSEVPLTDVRTFLPLKGYPQKSQARDRFSTGPQILDHSVADEYRGASIIRNSVPPRTTIGLLAWAYCRVLGGSCLL